MFFISINENQGIWRDCNHDLYNVKQKRQNVTQRSTIVLQTPFGEKKHTEALFVNFNNEH